MGNYNVEKKHVSRRIEKWFFLGTVVGGIIGVSGFIIFDNIYFLFSSFVFGAGGTLYGFILEKKEKEEKNKRIFSNK